LMHYGRDTMLEETKADVRVLLVKCYSWIRARCDQRERSKIC
jgi:hypothetical protein